MNRVNYIRIVTSALLVVSLIAPMIIKSLPIQTETLSEIIGFSKTPTTTSKADIQLLCEEKEKEEEFGVNAFQSTVLATGLIVDLIHFSFLDDQNKGLAIAKPSIQATPIYLLKHTLLI